MIIDKIENRHFYKLPKQLEEALEYMATTDLTSLAIGEYPLDCGLTLDIDEYTPASDWKKYEGHNYITHLRYIVKGSEKLGYANKQDVEFVEQKKADKFMYTGPESKVRVTEGCFVVLFPQDCHALKLVDQGDVLVRKASVSLVTSPEA